MLGLRAAATIGTILVVVACGSGGPPLPSNLGDLIDDLASAIPVGSEGTALDDPPGPLPRTITGQLTLVKDENVSDGDLTIDTTFTTAVRLRLSQDYGDGIGEYVDDGSTWTHAGRFYQNVSDAPPCPTQELTVTYQGDGGYGGTERQIFATTRLDSEIGWSLDFNATVDDAPGRSVLTNQGEDCHTVEGTQPDNPGIVCLVVWQAPATFRFDEVCDVRVETGGLTTTGTLTGGQ